ncbi:hypothetical protein [Sulfurospirillum barnesii]|uniref:Uncharacterized protein n=1 Tax=Sulfurospirillum barnesii (strain ATCC 700032 / DSM 10660 / SES-3) TaxID=760154 RepID=I3XX97_SULBS|nr:hypothetical protein [Sulfurospirillum barnesii]AFL68571.1 hypothetical protein Sulba_1279 [Sulfurospirillum barnesii SES-3]
MEQLIPVLMIVAMVAFVLAKQIGKITTKLDTFSKTESYEHYAKFSSIIQEEVREIKQNIDTSKSIDKAVYVLLEGKDERDALEILSDFIRKLVFFETLMAKQKSAREIEAELFDVLNGLEHFLKEFCVDGEALSDALRERLLEAYERLDEEEEA